MNGVKYDFGIDALSNHFDEKVVKKNCGFLFLNNVEYLKQGSDRHLVTNRHKKKSNALISQNCHGTLLCVVPRSKLLCNADLSLCKKSTSRLIYSEILLSKPSKVCIDFSIFLKRFITTMAKRNTKAVLNPDYCRNVKEKDQNFYEIKNNLSSGNHEMKQCLYFSSSKGINGKKMNQDSFIYRFYSTFAIYAVFDGHGPCGHLASQLCLSVVNYIAKDENLYDKTGNVISNAFLQADKKLQNYCESKKCDGKSNNIDFSISGTTCTVVVHLYESNLLYIGYVGDSRCVMVSREDKKFQPCNEKLINVNEKIESNSQMLQVLDLTVDHRVSCPEEYRRIRKCGGLISKVSKHDDYRLSIPDTNNNSVRLNMSRSLGDFQLKNYGLICEPSITVVELDKSNDFYLLLCTDGVWSQLSSIQAAKVVSDYIINYRKVNNLDLNEKIINPAEHLTNYASKKWKQMNELYVDDITALFIPIAKLS